MPRDTPDALKRPFGMNRRASDVPPPEPTAPIVAARPTAAPPVIYVAPAGALRRLLATTLDLAVAVAVGAAVWAVARAAKVELPRSLPTAIALLATLVTAQAVAAATLLRGRSIGRRLTGVHILDGEGLVPSSPRLVLRSLLSLVSIALCGAGMWLALFERRNRTLHDMLTGTFSVRKKDR